LDYVSLVIIKMIEPSGAYYISGSSKNKNYFGRRGRRGRDRMVV